MMSFVTKAPIVSLCVLLLAGGCATTVVPPAHVDDPVAVYLTDYGRHSSLLLPRRTGGYDEFAFGDWNFFAKGNTAWWVQVQAMLRSPQATLGRRFVAYSGRDDEKLQKALGADRLIRIEVSRLRAEVLAEDLSAAFRRREEDLIFSDYSRLDHIPDDAHYWGLHNCNHVTAEWLRRLGCEVNGPAMLSNFVVRPPED